MSNLSDSSLPTATNLLAGLGDPERLAERQQRLRRAKRVATAAVFAMAALFAVAHFLPVPSFWRELLRTAGEAGTVGGLADWFAVTALFRRPLGLPIPHTALIPTRKDEIAHEMARFVEEHFLNATTLVRRVKEADRAAQIGAWLAGEEASHFLAMRLLTLCHEMVQRGTHLHLMEAALPLARMISREMRDVLQREVGKRTGWLIPSFVDKHLARSVSDEIDRMIEALDTPDSPERAAMDGWLRARLDEIPAAWRDAAHQVWGEIKQAAAAGEPSQAPPMVSAIAALIQRAGTALVTSEDARSWVNGSIERLIIDYIVPWRGQIGRYMESVVRSWDARQVAAIIELQVGRDLQYVRLNGTLIGSLIGIGLFLVSWFAGVR